jgi:hypothetical protein
LYCFAKAIPSPFSASTAKNTAFSNAAINSESAFASRANFLQ